MDPLAAGLGALQGERGCSGLRVQVRASRCAHAGCAHGSPRLLLFACRARGLGPSILLVAVTRSCAAGLERCLLRICVQLGPTSGCINPFMRSWTPWVAVWAWLPMLHLSG